MKIIDENGRIFKKINIIDLVVLAVVIIFLFWGVKKLIETETYSDIYIRLRLCEKEGDKISNCGNLPLYYSDIVQEGDAIFLEDKISGIIIDKSIRKDSDLGSSIDINLIIKLRALEKKNYYYFEDTLINLNERLNIDTNRTKLAGKIIKFNKNYSDVKFDQYQKEVEIVLRNQPSEVANKIKKGDKELDYDKNTVAEIVDYKIYPIQNSDEKNIVIEAKINTLFFDDSYWFKNKKLKVGQDIFIETEEFILKGRINRIESKEYPKLEKRAIIKIFNQPKFIAEKIKENDKEIDLKGKVVAEVLSKEVKKAEIEITTDNGEIVLAVSPTREDIILEVLLMAEKIYDKVYFHDNLLRVGNDIFLSLNEIDVSGKIIDIK